MKTVTILGSTGSVGVNTLKVIKEHSKLFKAAGLAAGSQVDLLEEEIREFSPKAVYVKDAKRCFELSKKVQGSVKFFSEKETLESFASFVDADILVVATSGTSALHAVLDAIEKGKTIALANKEILVVAGELVMQKLKEYPKSRLIPVDSEHSAIFQCLQGNSLQSLERIILTGSGGPLREISKENFYRISKEIVVNHPKWKMGKKISVDSATLMNKGLEIIEASYLFDVPISKIDILIHPEAVIHSMVEFKDGAILAQLGVTDMKLPIQYALSYPDRIPCAPNLRLDFSTLEKLSFLRPDREKFPCLEIAYEAAKKAGSAPCVLSAADEVAVGAFLADQIDFTEIPQVIEKVISNHRHVLNPNLSEILEIHDWATQETKRLCQVH